MLKEETMAMFAALGRGERVELLFQDGWLERTIEDILRQGIPKGYCSWRVKRDPVVIDCERTARVRRDLCSSYAVLDPLHIQPEHEGKRFRVVATEILEEPSVRLKIGTRVRTNKRLDLATDRGFLHGTHRINNEDGTVEEVSDSHGLRYGVRHNDGALGCYDHDELTVIP